jgi:carboxymethylenebutenolidase
VFTEIYQVTGPLHRFCRQIASHGYVVACPESFHEFEEAGVAIPYDEEGMTGNRPCDNMYHSAFLKLLL